MFDGMNKNELRFAVRVYASVEKIVCCRLNDRPGPLTLMLGMSSIIGGRTKLRYVMNLLQKRGVEYKIRLFWVLTVELLHRLCWNDAK